MSSAPAMETASRTSSPHQHGIALAAPAHGLTEVLLPRTTTRPSRRHVDLPLHRTATPSCWPRVTAVRPSETRRCWLPNAPRPRPN